MSKAISFYDNNFLFWCA